MKDRTLKSEDRCGNSPKKRTSAMGGARSSPDIRSVLLRYMIAFFALMILALWILVSVFLDDFYRGIKRREIAEAYRRLSQLELSDDCEDEARSIAERYSLCVSIYRVSGGSRAETLAEIHTLSHCTVHNTEGRSKFVLYDAAVKNGGEYLRYFAYDDTMRVFTSISDDDAANSGDEVSMLYVGVTAGGDGGDVLTILDTVITPVSAAVNTIYVQLGLFTVFFIVMSVLFTMVLSRRFATPLAELTEKAKRFGDAHGDGTDMHVSGYREIELLSETLDHASGELAKNELLRRELVANFSHDLRTPLTMIIGYGEMMRDIPGESSPENAANIVCEAERLNRLVSDMLELSRLSSGTAELKDERFSLAGLACDAAKRYGELTEHDGFRVVFLTDGSDAYVYSDPGRVERVLQNLVGNALQHTGADKLVEISVSERGGWATVAVRDTGDGIPPEALPELWERYYKVNSAHRRGSGTGLGLSIVKATMEQLGGHYGVDSAIGVGSVFWFSLPISPG